MFWIFPLNSVNKCISLLLVVDKHYQYAYSVFKSFEFYITLCIVQLFHVNLVPNRNIYSYGRGHILLYYMLSGSTLYRYFHWCLCLMLWCLVLLILVYYQFYYPEMFWPCCVTSASTLINTVELCSSFDISM